MALERREVYEDGDFLDLNVEVLRRMELKAMLDFFIDKGLMGHDPQTGLYWVMADVPIDEIGIAAEEYEKRRNAGE